MGALTIILHGHRSPSQNTYYSAPHWSVRSRLARQIHDTVRRRLMAMGIEMGTTCNRLVDIEVIAYFDQRPLDSDNVCSKLYIDALRGWLLEDDSPRWVRRVTTESRVSMDPRVEITLIEAST